MVRKSIAARHMVFVFVLLIGIVALAAGCGQSDKEKAEADYDKAKADLKASVQELQKPEAYGSADSLKSAFTDVQTAYEDTVESGKDLSDARVSEVEDAYDELKGSVEGIDSDKSLELRLNELRGAIQKFGDQLKQI